MIYQPKQEPYKEPLSIKLIVETLRHKAENAQGELAHLVNDIVKAVNDENPSRRKFLKKAAAASVSLAINPFPTLEDLSKYIDNEINTIIKPLQERFPYSLKEGMKVYGEVDSIKSIDEITKIQYSETFQAINDLQDWDLKGRLLKSLIQFYSKDQPPELRRKAYDEIRRGLNKTVRKTEIIITKSVWDKFANNNDENPIQDNLLKHQSFPTYIKNNIRVLNSKRGGKDPVGIWPEDTKFMPVENARVIIVDDSLVSTFSYPPTDHTKEIPKHSLGEFPADVVMSELYTKNNDNSDTGVANYLLDNLVRVKDPKTNTKIIISMEWLHEAMHKYAGLPDYYWGSIQAQKFMNMITGAVLSTKPNVKEFINGFGDVMTSLEFRSINWADILEYMVFKQGILRNPPVIGLCTMSDPVEMTSYYNKHRTFGFAGDFQVTEKLLFEKKYFKTEEEARAFSNQVILGSKDPDERIMLAIEVEKVRHHFAGGLGKEEYYARIVWRSKSPTFQTSKFSDSLSDIVVVVLADGSRIPIPSNTFNFISAFCSNAFGSDNSITLNLGVHSDVKTADLINNYPNDQFSMTAEYITYTELMQKKELNQKMLMSPNKFPDTPVLLYSIQFPPIDKVILSGAGFPKNENLFVAISLRKISSKQDPKTMATEWPSEVSQLKN